MSDCTDFLFYFSTIGFPYDAARSFH